MDLTPERAFGDSKLARALGMEAPLAIMLDERVA
jgi:hypothetical protein